MSEPPRTERILRLAISVYGKREDRAAGHDFAVNNHVIKAAKIHASYGMQMYQQVFTPPEFREIVSTMNKNRNRGWVIDDHDVTVEFYFKSLADLAKLSADPEWQAIQQEEEPYIDRRNTVVSLGWVEMYVENGKVVNQHDGKSTYGSWAELSDTSTAWDSTASNHKPQG